MSVASIDLEQMAELIRAMENASTELESRVGSVRGHLTDVWLSTDDLNRVNGVLSWIDEELPGLRRRLALARHVEAQTPGVQTFAQIDESTISTATPEEARERADRAAELIEEYDDGEIPEELRELLADNATDPYFAQRLAEQVSPDDVAAVVLDMSYARQALAQSHGMTSDVSEVDTFDGHYETFLNDLGTSLGLATQNTGDLALDPEYAEQWLDAIITEEPANVGQAGALSLVISRGTWSADFLTTVARGVYDYERDVDERDMWYNRSASAGELTGAIDPVHGDEEGAPTGYSVHYDPLAGIMAAIGRSPQAGHELFGHGETVEIEADGETAHVNAFMEYLIARRRWPVDDGAGAREAIAAAMTPFEGGDVISADIATDARAIVTMKAEEIEERSDTNWFSEIGHLVLDGLGLIPVVGEPADAINAIWYAAEGNVIDAGLSGAALIPFLGWGSTAGKWTRRALTAEELTILGRLDTFPAGFDSVSMVARADGVPLPTFEFSNLRAFNRAANNAHPNARYVFNGVAWETDSLGRPIRVEGSPSGSAAGRNRRLQQGIGHEGIDGDVGFHILADSLGGPTNRLNVVPGNGKPLGDGMRNLNQGRYADMERYLREALGNNQNVQVDIVPSYRPDNLTTRPDLFTVRTWVDGELREFRFPNRPG
ncbi:DNA/RNA non-specific endonuclease [Jiangella rhizosphaerae]|uniref:Type VII secretion system protein EssD-like domain-containing protein n=1 Tax=Jiangella rhizosphaerae TaxID=2293569 RepID=A0A418KT65_9ACTN|nr:DUF6571 family protein [Jiangella rhizosphaerae]RIQ28159.1 hypothetical protein DY240_09285 [Jiangella rhizosphaerae]